MTRDDMTIVPVLAGGTNTPKERAAEERKTQIVRMRRNRIARKVRNAQRARRVASRGRKIAGGFNKAAAKKAAQAGAAKLGSRAVPVAGWALLLVDLVTVGGQLARRIGEGKSGRLVEAEDAQTLYGDLDNEATANAFALGEIEKDPALLRAIGQDGKINSSIQAMIDVSKRRALVRSQGADIIDRDPAFDSRDSFLDKALGAARDAALKDQTDEIVQKIKARGFGKLSTGR